ncbi:MAG: hypothetical protein JWM05_3346, partial [Acidimicrobiales bacterium]|nr:hypothetical protein [Acidimicrobiales bacterium]
MRRQTTTPEEPTMDDTSDLTSDVSRRRFLAGAGVAAGTVAVASTLDLAACSRSTGSASLPPEPIEHGVLDSLVTARAPRLSIGFIERSAGHATLAA